MTTNLEKLKFNLQERQYPYFTDIELELLLENYNDNIWKASFQGCLLKANADDSVTLGPLKTSSNRDYWLGLAQQYQEENVKTNTSSTDVGYYVTSMKRADNL